MVSDRTSLTVSLSKDILENPSEFINNIGDNFNRIMQTKSSRWIKKLSKHSPIWRRKNSDLATWKIYAGNVLSSVESLRKAREHSEIAPDSDNSSQFQR